MADEQPDMMLWLGDNIYLREVDLSIVRGFRASVHPRQTNAGDEAFASSLPNYAIWDDHDFGPNDSDGSWVHADWSRESFEAFWSNPATAFLKRRVASPRRSDLWTWSSSCWTTGPTGSTTKTRPMPLRCWGRPNRLAHPGPAEIQGAVQVWCVGGQVLNDAAVYENVSQFPSERHRSWSALRKKTSGGGFLVWRPPHDELSEYTMGNGRKVYDLTVSPLTSRAAHAADEPNSSGWTDVCGAAELRQVVL